MVRKRLPAREVLDKRYEWNSKYSKEHYVSFLFKFSKDTEGDIIEWLQAQTSKKNAVAAIIRKEIAKGE